MARILATRAQVQPTRDRQRHVRPDIEGLCAVAVVLLVAHHARLGFSGGYVGVDVLFVVSGYLATLHLRRERDDQRQTAPMAFVAPFVRRILPLASIVLMATIAGSAVFLSSSHLNAVARDGRWTALFLANFHFASVGGNPLDPASSVSLLQQFWAVCVAVQLLLACALVLLPALHVAQRGRRGRRVLVGIGAVLGAASLAWCVRETSTDATAAFFSTFTRAWELGAGAMLALAAPTLARLPRNVTAALGWAGIGLIAYAALGFDSATAFPGWAAVAPVTGAVAVLAAGATSARNSPGALLGRRPIVALAAYSYSFYLWQWPVLAIAETKYSGLGTIERILLVVFAAALSVASAHLVERPVRRSGMLTRSSSRTLVVGAACVAVSLLYAEMTVVAQEAVARRDQLLLDAEQRAANAWTVAPLATAEQIQRAVTAASSVTGVPGDVRPPVSLASRDVSLAVQDGCLLDRGAMESPPCRYGDLDAAETVVLFGDEQAIQWLPALVDLSDRQSFGVVVLAKGACPDAEVATDDDCVRWRLSALERIAALHPAVVVVGAESPPTVAPLGQAGLRATLDRLSRSAGRVVLLSETPAHTMSVPACLADNPRNIGLCGALAREELQATGTSASRATAQAAGVRFVDVRPWLCSAIACPPIIDGRITMLDSARLTSTYASYLSHVLGVETGLESATETAAFTGGATDAEVRTAVAAAADGRQPSSALRPPPNIAATEASPAFSDGCLVARTKTTSPTCQFGDLGSTADVVLLGDSRAAHWMPAMVGAATRNNLRLTVLTKANCPAPTMAVYLFTLERPFIECDQWREYALRRIAAMRPSLVIVSSTFHGVAIPGGQREDTATEDAWALGLVTTIERLQASGARVVVVGEEAAHAQRVPECIQANEQSLLSCATPVAQGILVAHRANEQQVVAERTTATYVDSAPWFCTTVTCPAVINGIVTAFDEGHLTATYSAYLSHALATAVGLER